MANRVNNQSPYGVFSLWRERGIREVWSPEASLVYVVRYAAAALCTDGLCVVYALLSPSQTSLPILPSNLCSVDGGWGAVGCAREKRSAQGAPAHPARMELTGRVNVSVSAAATGPLTGPRVHTLCQSQKFFSTERRQGCSRKTNNDRRNLSRS